MIEKQITNNPKELAKLPLCTTVFAVLMAILIVIKTLNLADISWLFVFLIPMCANFCWVTFSHVLMVATMFGWMFIQVFVRSPRH